MDTFFDLVRLVNAISASLVFCALCYRGRLYFSRYGRRQQLLYVSFTIYAFGTAYGSVEAYNMNVPPGLRTIPFLVANLIALSAFVMYRDSALSAPDEQTGA